jgi:cytidyltransferase-like protein
MNWLANTLRLAVWQKNFIFNPQKNWQRYYLITLCGTFVSACTNNSTSISSEALIETYEFKSLQTMHQKKIVLIGGCFDVLHLGHIEFLKKAKAAGDYLVVTLEPDERLLKYKHRKSTHTQKERAYILSTIRFVDKVILLPVLNGFDGYLKLVRDINPSVIAVTADDPQFENKKKQAKAINGIVEVVINRLEGFSTSAIRGANRNIVYSEDNTFFCIRLLWNDHE